MLLDLTYGPSRRREYTNVVERQSHTLVAPADEASHLGEDGDDGDSGVSPLWCVFQQALEHKVRGPLTLTRCRQDTAQ